MQNIVELNRNSRGVTPSIEARQQLQLRSIRKKVALPTSQGTFLVRWTDIIYCRAESNYCWVYRKCGDPILVSKTLKDVTDLLPSAAFVRVHQTYLVCLDAIGMFTRDQVTLECGVKIPVSRSKRSELIQSLNTITTS